MLFPPRGHAFFNDNCSFDHANPRAARRDCRLARTNYFATALHYAVNGFWDNNAPVWEGSQGVGCPSVHYLKACVARVRGTRALKHVPQLRTVSLILAGGASVSMCVLTQNVLRLSTMLFVYLGLLQALGIKSSYGMFSQESPGNWEFKTVTLIRSGPDQSYGFCLANKYCYTFIYDY